MLERGPLGRAKPALVRGFIVSTLKRLVEDGVSRDEAERLAAGLRAGAAMHVAEFRSVAAEPGFPTPCSVACAAGGGRRVLRLLALVPDVRAPVLAAVHAQLEELLERLEEAELAEAVHDALDVPALAARAAARVPSINRNRLAKLIGLRPRKEYAACAIEVYLGSTSYDAANFSAENLVLPLAEFVSAEDAARIAEKAREPNSQIGGGYRFGAVKARLEELGVWPVEPPVQIAPEDPLAPEGSGVTVRHAGAHLR